MGSCFENLGMKVIGDRLDHSKGTSRHVFMLGNLTSAVNKGKDIAGVPVVVHHVARRRSASGLTRRSPFAPYDNRPIPEPGANLISADSPYAPECPLPPLPIPAGRGGE